MKSTSAAQTSIQPLSPADCAEAAAASNFARRSATAASGSACAKATRGVAVRSSRDQTHLDAPQVLLIIDFSRLSLFVNDSRTPAGTGSGEGEGCRVHSG